ncbi:MAG: hypothetical protein WBA84_07665 [Carnobacterium sp.]|uniref:hypothetical protein n=1 Tax=Carnobacterium sp. TaxID=48221 RepID=UPI003C73DA2F
MDNEMWDNHERRIGSLERSNEDIRSSLGDLKESLSVNQATSAERSRILMNQSESLMRQNERLSTQMGNVFDTVTTTRENEAKRSNEMKKLSTDTRLKMITIIVGSGSAGYLIIETLIKLIGGM